MIRLLHTSDWHIGRSLYGQKRYREHETFLDWLIEFIAAQKIDVLIIAGDIFDTTTPSNHSQKLYYRFLSRVSFSGCRHVIVTGGNHDSPSFLDAPAQLLETLNVHVVGSADPDLDREIILLCDASGTPEMLVCAVPYLRDRDIRTAGVGESIDEKTSRLIEGIKRHYTAVWEKAGEYLKEQKELPVVGTGHLFASGGVTVNGDGVRQLYVGTIAHVGQDVFPSGFDYIALGHLHSAQVVAKKETIRYSGSPLPMGFGEAGQEKKVVLASFDKKKPSIEEHTVPVFQELKQVSGSMDQILAEVRKLKDRQSRAWLEIDYAGQLGAARLRQDLEAAVEDSDLQILRIRNLGMSQKLLRLDDTCQVLEDIDPLDVFERLLDAHALEKGKRPELISAYREILTHVLEKDTNAG